MKATIINSWLSLGIGIIFSVLGTMSMKKSHGLQYFIPSLCLAIFYTISFVALTFAMNHLELSVVYAVWSGVGTILMALIGIFHFNESVSFRKMIFLSLIVFGVVGVHLSDYFA